MLQDGNFPIPYSVHLVRTCQIKYLTDDQLDKHADNVLSALRSLAVEEMDIRAEYNRRQPRLIEFSRLQWDEIETLRQRLNEWDERPTTTQPPS